MLIHLIAPIVMVLTLLAWVGALCSLSHTNIASALLRKQLRLAALCMPVMLVIVLLLPSCYEQVCLSGYERVLLDFKKHPLGAILTTD